MSASNVKDTIDGMYALIQNELPAPVGEFGRYEDRLVEMRDGVRLMTRILFPEGEGPWPVILVRNPYSPVNSLLHMQQPIFVLTRYGYTVVYQQARGTFDSEGEWLPFEHERKDGLDTLHWLTKQPWMNGAIGTFGGSYLGHVQWSVADLVPPEVKTMYFSIYGGDPYEGYYQNGTFKFGGWAFWAMEMMQPSRNLDVNPLEVRQRSIERFHQVQRVRPHAQIDCQLFDRESPWYRNWVTNPYPSDPYWTQGYWEDYRKIAEKIQIPIMFQGGWFDFFLDSMIKSYLRLPEATKAMSRFVISPWHHGNMTGGDLGYPGNNILGTALIKDALEWFDHHLKGTPYPHPKGVVETYVIGEGAWKTWQGWIQPTRTQTYYLGASREGPGQAAELAHAPVETASTIPYIYNPRDPVPSQGGNMLTGYPKLDEEPECSTAQDAPGTRDDVITFLSQPLEEELPIAGSMTVHLFVSSDAEDTAFTAKVMEVFESGKAYNIQDGIATLALRHGGPQPTGYTSGAIVEVVLDLTPITWTMKKGSRLRLDISSSNFPAYHAHPNLAGTWSLQTESRIAHQKLHLGGPYPSFIQLPLSR